MVQKKRIIPNPNKMSEMERDFLKKNDSTSKELFKSEVKKNTYKGRMISMSDEFFIQLNEYLSEHPTEGNRSGFIVRVVAEYIERKKH